MIIKIMSVDDVPNAHENVQKKEKAHLIKDTVEHFVNSSSECIEIIDDEGFWANSNNFRRGFQSYVDKNYANYVIVTIRGNRVFLIKERVQ